MRGIWLGTLAAVLSGAFLPLGVWATSRVELYQDSGLSDSSTHFEMGATMYFKVNLDFSPDDEAVLRVKRMDGAEVSSLSLKKEPAFFASIVLPNESGSYLVEFIFRGQGSEYRLNRSIQLGDNGGDSTVKVSMTNVFNPVPPVSAKPVYQPPREIQYPGGVQRNTSLPTILSTATPYHTPTPSLVPLPKEEEEVTPVPSAEPTGSPSPQPGKEQTLFSRIGQIISGFIERVFSFLRLVGLG